MEVEEIVLRILQGIGVIATLLGIWFLGRLLRNLFRPLQITTVGLPHSGSDSEENIDDFGSGVDSTSDKK